MTPKTAFFVKKIIEPVVQLNNFR